MEWFDSTNIITCTKQNRIIQMVEVVKADETYQSKKRGANAN